MSLIAKLDEFLPKPEKGGMPFNHANFFLRQRVTAELLHPLQAPCIFKETMPDSLLSLILKHYRTMLALLQTYSFFTFIFLLKYKKLKY
jgi:hypothetical protein